VINQKRDISYLGKKFYVVSHSTFDFKFFIVLIQAYKILKKEKPDLIVSTGASLAVQFFILAKILNIKTLFIESFTRVKDLSKTGKIIKLLTKNFYVQTITLNKKFNLKILHPLI
jgi:UDP-N-acetylglucosamine:LPS N-acetylglucosamine transferase